jgi:hypothetical protein
MDPQQNNIDLFFKINSTLQFHYVLLFLGKYLGLLYAFLLVMSIFV